MKTTILFLLLLLTSYSAFSQDDGLAGSEALNDKYGFRDATFEKPVSAFKSLKLLSSKGHEKTYTRSTDKLLIGQFPVKQIAYVFYDGLLSEVHVQVAGRDNVQGVLTAMATAYGQPIQDKGRHIEWASTRVQLVADISEQLTSTKLVMSSLPMGYRKLEGMRKANQAVEKAGVKAASDL